MATKKLKTKISRLEAIADALEQNDQDIEKALVLFEEGMQLIKECNGDLDGIEEKVTILTANAHEGLQEIPYEGETEV
ncbi:MAG: exodeoxyribonuclease VII small subunit [Eubacterium sp.]